MKIAYVQTYILQMYNPQNVTPGLLIDLTHQCLTPCESAKKFKKVTLTEVCPFREVKVRLVQVQYRSSLTDGSSGTAGVAEVSGGGG